SRHDNRVERRDAGQPQHAVSERKTHTANKFKRSKMIPCQFVKSANALDGMNFLDKLRQNSRLIAAAGTHFQYFSRNAILARHRNHTSNDPGLRNGLPITYG